MTPVEFQELGSEVKRKEAARAFAMEAPVEDLPLVRHTEVRFKRAAEGQGPSYIWTGSQIVRLRRNDVMPLCPASDGAWTKRGAL